MISCPDRDCSFCPRLSTFIQQNRQKFPDKFNAPVPAFGPETAEFLIVGLAPGLRGANFSGRPFTGDYAGELLYNTLIDYGYAKGVFKADPNDGLKLVNTRIVNAVRCVPPENKPTGDEINTCNQFLKSELAGLKKLKVVLSLGLVSHNAVLKASGLKMSAAKFAHGAVHTLPNVTLIDSYHCSRYNTNTGRLTEGMFRSVFDKIAKLV